MIKDIINDNFKDKLMDIYLVNGIKMKAYIEEIQEKKFLVLRNNLTNNAINHIVFWTTIVTINQTLDNDKKTSRVFLLENLQQSEDNNLFLDKIINIYLSNGIKLDGKAILVKEQNYIILEKNNQQQIVLWHSIATMSIVNNIIPIESIENKKNNEPLKKLLNSKVAIFLKGGVKLQGVLTDFSDKDGNEEEWNLVLDKKQFIRIKHVSTISKSL